MMKERLEEYIKGALTELDIADVVFTLEHPGDMAHGDWATNVAMIVAKRAAKNPRVLAEEIVAKLKGKSEHDIVGIEIAGPGFINFKLAPVVFDNTLSVALSLGDKWGWNNSLKGKKVIVEYTDPNPFKEFHIGHLMSNAIGESISRLVEASGAETKRACYQGDVGLHVARTVWSMYQGEINKNPDFLNRPINGTSEEQVRYLSSCYSLAPLRSGEMYIETRGHDVFERIVQRRDEADKQGEIIEISKKIYDHSDPQINELYDWGRSISLKYFEGIYKRLDTKFDHFFFESKTGEFGKKVVEENIGKIFEKSNSAIVYKGDESKGLHTRVFINKEGLPTYEAKELGLAKIKYDKFPYDVSIVITGNEVNDYFKVLLDAMQKVFPELAQKTEHYSHGMLRLPTGKMSSRTGDVVTATSLLDEACLRIKKNVEGVSEDIAEAAGVAAVKYSILRQSKEKDIIFDFDQSLSFEGDSGPYLQYTYARTRSVLEKAGNAPRSVDVPHKDYGALPKLLTRFPEIVLRASVEREPHHVANYLIEMAREFNSFYGNTTIVDGGADQSYKLALTEAVGLTLKNGLWLLGITAPIRM